MTIRFFILQAHYRGTLDFSNDALIAAGKGLNRLMKALSTLDEIVPSNHSSVDVNAVKEKCFSAINDDINTPALIAHLFDGVKSINSVKDEKETLNADDLDTLKKHYKLFVNDILGFTEEVSEQSDGPSNDDIEDLLKERHQAKLAKDWTTADKIRNQLSDLGIIIKDTKDGATWERS